MALAAYECRGKSEAEQIDGIYDYHAAGNFFVSAEDMAQTLKGLNPYEQ